MSATFVAQLRTGSKLIELANAGPGSITVRVEMSDLWETVRVVASPDTPVAELKRRVVMEFFPDHHYLGQFVFKLRGWEVLDEGASLSGVGVRDGAILLLAHRRRRPVR